MRPSPRRTCRTRRGVPLRAPPEIHALACCQRFLVGARKGTPLRIRRARGRAVTAILALPEPSYLDEGQGLRSWLLTTDHKRIAILYMLTITLMFGIGGAAATVIRLEL